MDGAGVSFEALTHITQRALAIIAAWPWPWVSLFMFELIWLELTGRPFEALGIGYVEDLMKRLQFAGAIFMQNLPDGRRVQLRPGTGADYFARSSSHRQPRLAGGTFWY